MVRALCGITTGERGEERIKQTSVGIDRSGAGRPAGWGLSLPAGHRRPACIIA
jgi:hypothetical protein